MNLDFSVIKESKNLLAFSAGVDSTALFFLLLEQNIPFDIAIVNYNTREQSHTEVQYAKELALKYNKKIFLKDVKLKSNSNFEKTARDIRYRFFEDIILENSYEVLLTAHQLNDKFEWFLMQLSKGAGLFELIGLNEFEQRNSYKIHKPLLEISKKDLEDYLVKNSIKYFLDSSNFENIYKRNYFRNEFANKFLEEFESGVKNSFKYLQNDLNSLNLNIKAIKVLEDLEIFENLNDDNLNIRVIDLSLKKRGILLSTAQRKEILKQKQITISHKINVAISEKYILIAPKAEVIMDKKFKEICRVKKIPSNIREYIYLKNIDLEEFNF